MLPVFPGSHSDTVPPDSIPNSEVKRISADGSVGFPHVRVGHCQVPLRKTRLTAGFLRLEETKKWGQSTLTPNSPAIHQIGVRVLYYPNHKNQVKVPLSSNEEKQEKCTPSPTLKCVFPRLHSLPAQVTVKVSFIK